MMNVKTSIVNQNKITRMETELGKILEEALKRGFYGTAGVTLKVQDGRIQHIRLTMDQIVK